MATPGGTRIPSPELVGIATFCTLWCLAFLTGSSPWAYLAVPLVFAGILLLRSRPAVGALVVVAANLVTLAAGVDYGGVDMMSAFAFALFSVGRMVRSRLVGVAITLAGAASTAARAPFEPFDLLVCTGVFGVMWLFGVLVRRRARSAWQAVAERERLVSEDPEEFAAAHLAEERQRLATEALLTLRRSVAEMQALAGGAEQAAPPSASIQQRGKEAVAELRALLGLLREPQAPPVDDPQPVKQAFTGPWAVLYAVAAAGTLVALILRPEDPEVLLPLGLLYALVSWRVAIHPDRLAWLLLGLLATLAAGVSIHYGVEGAGFLFVVFATAILAGWTWGERDQITTRALDESAVLQRHRDELVARALRAERLRIARDLHDVTSHAVGVMVMQANAAEALGHTDPARAGAALAQVGIAGDQALAEIDELLAMLDDGRRRVDPDLRQSLGGLCEQMRGVGLKVELRLLALPDAVTPGAEPALTIHRVVQEGLTNVLRHAPGARVLVEVDRAGTHWLVRVINDRPPMSAPSRRGSGFGLTGMAERVHALGGTLASGPRPGGGFLVEAHLPDAHLNRRRPRLNPR